jgi:hypothetical protein
MTAHSTAQGIASLGRYGDDLIVHMNQEEVQGLQALAKKHGTSLTINPDTGMPEAFKLGKVFKAVLPMAAGFALGPGGFGLFSSPIMAGLAVGATTGILTGNLGQGLMAGLGAYGGFGLGDTLAKMGATTAGGITPTMTANMTQAATGAPLVGASSQFISPFTPSGIAGGAGLGVGTVGGGAANAITNQAMNASLTGANAVANAGAAPVSGFAKSYEGVKNLFSPGGYDKLKNVLGTEIPATQDKIQSVSLGNQTGTITTPGTPATIKPATNMDVFKKIGTPIGGALLQGVEASDLNPQINLSDQEQKVYEQTGVDSAGKPTFGYIAKSAFNPYRTLNLSGPSPLNLGQALKLPATTGYAAGGTIGSGGIRDLYGSSDSQAQAPLSRDGYGLGRLNQLGNEQSLTQAKTLGYAEGGETGMNLDRLPSLNIKTGTQSYGDSNMPEGLQKLVTGFRMAGDSSNVNPGFRIFSRMMSGAFGGDPEMLGAFKGKGVPSSVLEGIDFKDYYDRNPSQYLPGYVPTAPAVSINPSSGNTSAQNSAFVNRRAKGGYLDGAGDGMSDSIPATIEGKQPARLADGEFVIPADVVSHLGNGSSKAGSKRLYAMLDKVRHARTGNKKQGKQINPARYMPA